MLLLPVYNIYNFCIYSMQIQRQWLNVSKYPSTAMFNWCEYHAKWDNGDGYITILQIIESYIFTKKKELTHSWNFRVRVRLTEAYLLRTFTPSLSLTFKSHTALPLWWWNAPIHSFYLVPSTTHVEKPAPFPAAEAKVSFALIGRARALHLAWNWR